MAIQLNVALQGSAGSPNAFSSSTRSIGTAKADQDAKAADVVHTPRAAGAAQDVAQTGAPVEAHRLDNAVKTLAEKMPLSANELQFTVDEESGRTIVTVIDPETEEVIRQLPPEEALQLAEALAEMGDVSGPAGAGLLVDGEA